MLSVCEHTINDHSVQNRVIFPSIEIRANVLDSAVTTVRRDWTLAAGFIIDSIF
jgi:hypothetical protein